MSCSKRWMLSLDGGATWPHEVNPINGAKVRLAEKKNLDRGQLFFRTELTTHLSIGGDVFKLLWNLERRGSRRCEPLLIRLEQKCGFAWNPRWTGEFSPGSCEWEVDNCLCNVKPEPVDRYACLLSKEKVKRNVLSLPAHSITGVEPSRLHIVLTTDPGPYPDGLVLATTFMDPRGNGCTIYVAWRETMVTPCAGGIGGTPVSPSTPGWTLQGNACAISGFSSWYRSPGFSWTSGTPVAGTIVGGLPTPPDDSCEWIHLLTSDVASSGEFIGCYDGVTNTDPNIPYYICPPLPVGIANTDRKSTRLNSSHTVIS